MDQWVTQGGTDPLPLEEEHCSVVEVTEEDIQNSVKFVPSLSAVVRKPESAPFTKQFSVKLIISRRDETLRVVAPFHLRSSVNLDCVHLHRGQGCLLTLFNCENKCVCVLLYLKAFLLVDHHFNPFLQWCLNSAAIAGIIHIKHNNLCKETTCLNGGNQIALMLHLFGNKLTQLRRHAQYSSTS